MTEIYLHWIDTVADWAAERAAILSPWCGACAQSDFADDVPGLRELPHSAVHDLLFGLENGYARARNRLVERDEDDLVSEWRMRTDPDFMIDGVAEVSEEFVLDLRRALIARRQAQQYQLEEWEESTRAVMHEALRVAAGEHSGLVLELVPRAIELAVSAEIEAIEIRSLRVWGGIDPRDAARMRVDIEPAMTAWMTWLPSAKLDVATPSVPQGERCELCVAKSSWLGEVDAPHVVTHRLVDALNRILRSVIDEADWQLHEAPFERSEEVVRYEHAFEMFMQGRHRNIARAIDVYVKAPLDAAIRAASAGIPAKPDEHLSSS